MNMPLVLLNRRRRGFTAFSPSTLFALAEPGVWFDPSDLTTLFQDPAGTTPVTAPGNTVGLMLDKSRGLALGSELVTNGDFSGGTTGWAAGFGTTTSTLTVSSGAGLLTVASPDTTPRYGRAITGLTVGKFYRVGCDTFSGSGTGDKYVGWTSLSNMTGGEAWLSTHTTPRYYPATATTMYVWFGFNGGAAGATITIDNISVRELAGNHATQATLASRPIYGIEPVGGRRNLLTYSEDLTNVVWQKVAATVTASATVAPDGTSTADKLVETPTTTFHGIRPSASEKTTQTWSLYAKEAERRYIILSLGESSTTTSGGAIFVDLRDGTVLSFAGAKLVSHEVTPAANGFYRCSVTVNSTGAATDPFPFVFLSDNSTHTIGASYGSKSYAGDGTSGVYVWGAQLEVSAAVTPYQRVTTQHDVTEAGVASVSYLYFDGVNDAMATSTITPGTDKAQVFAGVRKVSDASTIIAESSAGASPGSFAVYSQSTAGWGINSIGSLATSAAVTTGYASPITNVVTGLSNISGDSLLLRANGTQIAQSTADQGTGNFLAYPLYIGSRNNAQFYFNGHIYSLVVRFGANLDGTLISNTETWVAGKTGVTL
jgi:hypothetical protein